MTRRSLLLALGAAVPDLRAGAGPVDLGSRIEKVRRKADLPALAAMAFSSDAILAEGIAGKRRRGSEAAATLDDRFHVGSITKSMTAVLAGVMVETKRIEWESTIASVLGGIRMHPKIKSVTLWQLLCHRSGIERDIPDKLYERLRTSRIAPATQRQQIARVMLARPPKRPANTEYEYSNAGYTFAGMMLEKVGGKPWESLVVDLVLGPLGLKSAGFGAPAKNPESIAQPWGHRENGAPVKPGPDADNVPAIGPAGTVHLSVRDFARYARWHLAEAGPLQPALVRPATLQRLHGTAQPDAYYGGWQRVTRPWAGGQAITHAGSNTMFFAVVWLAPARDRGFIAVCNQGGDPSESACDSLIASLISEFIPA